MKYSLPNNHHAKGVVMPAIVNRNPKSTAAVVLITAVLIAGCSFLKPTDKIVKENFHLYLLIGQSNMAGRGEVSDQDRQIHQRVFALNKDNAWVPASDPIHFDKPIAGVGPGLTFGKVMADSKPGIRIGLIPCAAGGSSIRHWERDAYHEQTDSKPYDKALKRAVIAMKNGIVKGILWHQGEGDSIEESAPVYEQNLVSFVHRLRKDLGLPDVPFIAGQLGEFFREEHSFARVVNEAIIRLPEHVDNVAVVDSKGLTVKSDNVHFNAESAREFGRRYAAAMLKMED